MLRSRIGGVAAKVADWATKSRTPTEPTGTRLAPLTPTFDAAQHQTYVDHLNAAIESPTVRNIALTGRYGSGKSSILERFAQQPSTQKRVLSLALSTLGPEEPARSSTDQQSRPVSTTNRIEKELVKQLLHRERPTRLRQSRYQRIEVLPILRAVTEALVVVGALAVVLWALGVFPSVPGASGDHAWPIRLGAGIAVIAVPAAFGAWIRLAVHNRFAISELSAAGASISLTKAGSYFDEYLDEIVYFFEVARHIDIVLFEDLDRFDDPGIFEALRELNTLLNSSKQLGGRRMRFVYALRDSIFEKLSSAGSSEFSVDAADVEAARANRTKFFDLVIPIVPFITHRNARDLLTQILQDDRHGTVVPVSPALVDLTARHIPDMRLLRNIRNEYSVFAQRLITEEQGVRSLRADQLFALIVYKNIHLADFEDLLLGRSKLDDLYRLSRQLISEAIGVRRARLRAMADGAALEHELAKKSERWGRQLAWFVEEIRRAKEAVRRHSYTLSGYAVAGTAFDAGKVGDVEFWRAVIAAGAGLTVQLELQQGNPDPFQIEMAGLGRLLSDELPIGDWDSRERADLARERDQLEAEIDVLRTADFTELAANSNFTMSYKVAPQSFADLLASTIESTLGRALISEGYIDRYYTLYVAQYYGDNVPPNAMNFIVQNVDTNRCDVDYSFADDEEIAAVLRETKGSFLAEKSALNTAIVDYLFEHDADGARSVLDVATRERGDDERAFLDAYFTDGSSKVAGATYLGARWPQIFVYLIAQSNVTVEARLELVSSALAGASRLVNYEFDDAVRDYLQGNHQELQVVAQTSGGIAKQSFTDEEVSNAVAALGRAGVNLRDLTQLSPMAVQHAVKLDLYALTYRNLMTILGENAVLSLDSIAAINDDVYWDCLEHVDDYMAALSTQRAALAATTEGAGSDADSAPPAMASVTSGWTIQAPSEFPNVVAHLAAQHGEVPIEVLQRAHPDCVIHQLDEVPTEAWPALAQTYRFEPTLSNVDQYLQEVGNIDANLAATLVHAGRLLGVLDDDADQSSTEDEESLETKSRVAAAILNAQATIPDAATRVRLASSTGIGDWFPMSHVEPEDGKLLGHLVKAGIWSDERALVAYFSKPEWETLSFAIQQSEKFAGYMSPTLLDHPLTTKLLSSAEISSVVKKAVLERFDEFVDPTSRDALETAGRTALSTGTPLTAMNITGIAVGTSDPDLVVRLLEASGRSISVAEITSIFAHLPQPYNQISQPGAKLEFPRNDHHEAVLKQLRAAELISTKMQKRSLRKPARIDVTVR